MAAIPLPAKAGSLLAEVPMIYRFLSDEDLSCNIRAAADLLIVRDPISSILVCGNGGDAALADHFCTDLIKFAGIPALSLTGPSSMMTMIANDYGYLSSFSWRIHHFCCSEDILILLSTSGASKNIIEAAEIAWNKGMKTISIAGRWDSSAQLEQLSHIFIGVDGSDSMQIEDMQHIICHELVREICRKLGIKNTVHPDDA